MSVDLDNTIYGGKLSEGVTQLISKGIGFEWGKHVITESSVAGSPVELRRVKHNDEGLVESIDKVTDSVLEGSLSETVFDNRQLTTKELMYTQELPLTQFQSDHVKFHPKGLSVDLKASPEVEKAVRKSIGDYLLNTLSKRHSAGVSGVGSYDGFETKILEDSDCTQVGTGEVITRENVVSKINSLVDALPPRLKGDTYLGIFCSPNTSKKYVRSIVRTQGNSVLNKTDGALHALDVDGKKIKINPISGLSDDFVFITRASNEKGKGNLYQGVWVDDDLDKLCVCKANPADKVISFTFRGWFGVDYVTGEDIYYINGATTPATQTIYHVVSIGASQQGGYNSIPALTLSSRANVYTLTGGGLSPDVNGDLVPLVEGGTYDQDVNPVSFANVESFTTSMCQQLHSLLPDQNDLVVGTNHYRGGTTLQELNSGGVAANVGYTQLTNTIARVKQIADGMGHNYVPLFTIWTSGNGANPMDSAIQDWVDNVRSFTSPAYYSGVVKTLVIQSRITGSPDFGLGTYAGVSSRSMTEIAFPVRELLSSSEVQGDNIHFTNHGSRHVGVAMAYALRDNISGSFTPLDIDVDNASYNNSTDVITIPMTGTNNTVEVTGDASILVRDTSNNTNVSGTWSVSGSNLLFDISGNVPNGVATLEFRIGQGTGTIKEIVDNSGVLFTNSSGNRYEIGKRLIRHNPSKEFTFSSLTLSETININLTIDGSDSSDSNWVNVSNAGNSEFNNQETYTIGSGISLYRPNSGWSSGLFGSNSQFSGGGFTIPADVVNGVWAANSGSNNYLEIRGLSTSNRYSVHVLCNRNSGNELTHDFTFTGATSETISGISAEANLDTLASVELMQSDSSGNIRITDTPVGDTFRRINAIIIQVYTTS